MAVLFPSAGRGAVGTPAPSCLTGVQPELMLHCCFVCSSNYPQGCEEIEVLFGFFFDAVIEEPKHGGWHCFAGLQAIVISYLSLAASERP